MTETEVSSVLRKVKLFHSSGIVDKTYSPLEFVVVIERII